MNYPKNNRSRSRIARYLTALGWFIVTLLGFAIVPSSRAAEFAAADTAQLVAAITAINAAGSGEHTINLTTDITLTQELPTINNGSATLVTINGGTFTLNGDGTKTLLRIAANTTVKIANMTLTNGNGTSGPEGSGGGAIFNEGNLTVDDVSIEDNEAVVGGGILTYAAAGKTASLMVMNSDISLNQAERGGGVALFANGGIISATIKDSTVNNNTGKERGGGVLNISEGGKSDLSLIRAVLSDNIAFGDAAGVYNSAAGGSASTTISDSEVENNDAAGRGGAIFNYSEGAGTKTVVQAVRSAIFANSADSHGGAVYNSGSAGGIAQFYLDKSGLYQNSAGGDGGGLYSSNNEGDVSVSLTSSTVSSNNATGTGGGIYFGASPGISQLNLNYVTLAANSASTGGGLAGTGTGPSPISYLRGSIIADNSGGNCLVPGNYIRSLGYNLAGNESCNLAQPTDIPNGTADLKPLEMNAPGKSKTHALGTASQAIDRIPYGIQGCGVSTKDDQRGVARPQGIRCDIGAFESEQAPLSCSPPYIAGNDTQLNQAILCVNNAGSGEHTIDLNANIVLDAATAMINNTSASRISLNGGGFTLDGNNTGSVLNIAVDTVVEIDEVIITGGTGNNEQNNDLGGGIYNRGKLTLTNSTIIGNKGYSGAGIFNTSELGKTAEVTLINTTVINNRASHMGGGITSNGNEGQATVTLIGSAIMNNSATDYGGGIASNGFAGNSALIIEDSVITGNTSEFGSGLFNNGNGSTATLTMTGSTISGNTASVWGGGIYNTGNTGTATALITNSTISGNNAPNGDGIANGGNGGTANLVLNYSTIAANGSGNGNAIYNSSGATATVSSSILSAAVPGTACVNSNSTMQSGAYNLISDNSCGFNQTGDLENQDAGLLPLAANSPGSTQTHALSPTSAALARIPAGTNGCGTSITTDQRGAIRPTPGENCDVGAFEFSAGTQPPLDYDLFLPGIFRD